MECPLDIAKFPSGLIARTGRRSGQTDRRTEGRHHYVIRSQRDGRIILIIGVKNNFHCVLSVFCYRNLQFSLFSKTIRYVRYA